MSGRVAVVTGAASGIGLGIARKLAADGHTTALLDLDGDGARAAAADLSAQGSHAVAHGVDVADRLALGDVYSSVRDELGPITIVVTSAGIEAFDPVAEVTSEKWDRILAVNLTGTFTCLQLAIPDMIDASWGRIVTISSSSVQSGAPNMAHYVASKGGVIGLTKALANSPATTSRSTPSHQRSWTHPWLGRVRPKATSRASRSSPRWSPSAGRGLPTTSGRPARSSAPRRGATSPAR